MRQGGGGCACAYCRSPGEQRARGEGGGGGVAGGQVLEAAAKHELHSAGRETGPRMPYTSVVSLKLHHGGHGLHGARWLATHPSLAQIRSGVLLQALTWPQHRFAHISAEHAGSCACAPGRRRCSPSTVAACRPRRAPPARGAAQPRRGTAAAAHTAHASVHRRVNRADSHLVSSMRCCGHIPLLPASTPAHQTTHTHVHHGMGGTAAGPGRPFDLFIYPLKEGPARGASFPPPAHPLHVRSGGPHSRARSRRRRTRSCRGCVPGTRARAAWWRRRPRAPPPRTPPPRQT